MQRDNGRLLWLTKAQFNAAWALLVAVVLQGYEESKYGLESGFATATAKEHSISTGKKLKLPVPECVYDRCRTGKDVLRTHHLSNICHEHFPTQESFFPGAAQARTLYI